nr:DUF551 domain-containing protein [Klebsiella variicola]
MTSKLTREQLHERARENVKALKMASRQTAFESAHEEILADLQLAELALAAMDSSESVEMPLDYLQGHKDGLEWAAQLAEANHPETGDWLYDDPIELAKAIRKGPDMPPAQPVADSEPVAWTWQHLKQWRVTNDEERARDLAWDGVKVEPLYRHAQPAPVVPEEMTPQQASRSYGGEVRGYRAGWNACRAVMLAAAPQSPGSEPATVPGKWIPVSERMPDENAEQQVLACFKGGDISTLYYFEGRWDDAYGIAPIRQDVTHWMPLPAVPQEVKGE